jgi:hypothetical protein
MPNVRAKGPPLGGGAHVFKRHHEVIATIASGLRINTEGLRAKLDNLRAELAALDIEGARAQADAAQKALDELDAQMGQSAPVGASGRDPVAEALTARRGAISQAMKAARGAVLTKEQRAKVLQPQIERLSVAQADGHGMWWLEAALTWARSRDKLSTAAALPSSMWAAQVQPKAKRRAK